MRLILQAILGLLLILAGFGGGFYFIRFASGQRVWLLAIPVVLITTGLFILVKAWRQRNTVVEETTAQEEVVVKPVNLLERNNQIMQEWSKTNETRDQLKMLQLANNVENSK